MVGLTARQKSIFEYLKWYVGRFGYPPAIRDIQEQFGIGSLRGVTQNLDAIERKGYIERDPGVPRGIRIAPEKTDPRTAALTQILEVVNSTEPSLLDSVKLDKIRELASPVGLWGVG